MKNYSNEFKAGFLILLAIITLGYITVKTGKLPLKQEGYSIFVIFDEISGLEDKAPVMLNGLTVGKVDGIEPVYQEDKTFIKLKLWIEKKAQIRKGAKVSIKTLGLMGEKYIQIASHTGEQFIMPGEILQGVSMQDLDAIMEEALVISKKVESLIDEVKILSTNLNLTVSENKTTLSQMLKNFESTSQNIEEMSADLKRHPWKLLYRKERK